MLAHDAKNGKEREVALRDVAPSIVQVDRVRAAVNRAARSIGGEKLSGVIEFPTETAQMASRSKVSAVSER